MSTPDAPIKHYPKFILGRATLELARKAKSDPEIWAKVQARAAEIRAQSGASGGK